MLRTTLRQRCPAVYAISTSRSIITAKRISQLYYDSNLPSILVIGSTTKGFVGHFRQPRLGQHRPDNPPIPSLHQVRSRDLGSGSELFSRQRFKSCRKLVTTGVSLTLSECEAAHYPLFYSLGTSYENNVVWIPNSIRIFSDSPRGEAMAQFGVLLASLGQPFPTDELHCSPPGSQVRSNLIATIRGLGAIILRSRFCRSYRRI